MRAPTRRGRPRPRANRIRGAAAGYRKGERSAGRPHQDRPTHAGQPGRLNEFACLLDLPKWYPDSSRSKVISWEMVSMPLIDLRVWGYRSENRLNGRRIQQTELRGFRYERQHFVLDWNGSCRKNSFPKLHQCGVSEKCNIVMELLAVQKSGIAHL